MDVRELLGGSPRSSGGPHGYSEVVRKPSQMSLRGGRPFRMTGNGWETLPDV